jgi:hypothetical protein
MSGTVYEIPTGGGALFYNIALAGTTYQFVFQYRDAPAAWAGGGGWVLDINDTGGNPILCGIPLVTGADLLAQYAYLAFGGQLWVTTDGAPDAVPTYLNLGAVPGGHLYWIPA